jgi:hypothetical protein
LNMAIFRPIKLLLCALAFVALNLPAEGAVLDLTVKNIDGSPAAGVIFQIFPGHINIDDLRDSDGDGKIDEQGETFAGYATAADGKLRLDLADGVYTLVGFSRELHFVTVNEVSVPGSLNISVADAVPVSINCRAADGSPIKNAEIFLRPTKQARASVGTTDNTGSLNARVSPGEYHAVLRSFFGQGPHYLVLPNQKISPPMTEVNFHVADIPTGELHFDLPTNTALAIFEVLESTYTYEYAEGVEPEIGYDAAYTDFYPFISSEYSYTLSAGIEYNFNMSFAVVFGEGTIYAYELRPALHLIEPGLQRIGITDNDTFTQQILSDRGSTAPIYYPGERVELYYYFRDRKRNLLNRLLSFSEARLIFPIVNVWDPNGVPITNNFGTEDFFGFGFDLPLSAATGEYRAEVSLDAGMYGEMTGDFRFHVRASSDSEPPRIAFLDIPAESEAGQDLAVSAAITDNVGLAGNPELCISIDNGASWTEIPMTPAGGYLYQAVVPSDLFGTGELRWQITAQDLAENTVERTEITTIVDTSPPVIEHKPIATAELGSDLRIQANVKDNAEIGEVVLFYTGMNEKTIEMSGKQGAYTASVPGSEVTFDGVDYYIRAMDTAGNTAFSPSENGTPQLAHITVKDTIAPTISHTPVAVGLANAPVTIEALILDNSGEVAATLFYKNDPGQDYQPIRMDKNENVYFAEIPAAEVVKGTLYYHITASDGADPDGNTRTSVKPASGNDYSIQVQSEPHGAPTRLEISPSGTQEAPLDMVAGESIHFAATGRGETGEILPADPIWTVTGGIGHIDQNGLFSAAGCIPGNGIGRIIATARYTDIHNVLLQAEVWVRISPGSPAHITLNPISITIAAGNSQRFAATVTDSYSNPLDVRENEINWRVDTDIGTVEDSIFTSLKAGSGNVIAEVNNIQAVSQLTVTPGPLREIVIAPSPPFSLSAGNEVERVAAGLKVQFTAKGYDAFDNYISIAPIWSVRGDVGTIQGDGIFRGGTAGTGQVAAIVGDISATVNVEVIPGALYSISVSPHNAYVPVSTQEHPSTQQFVADGWDIAGNQVPLKSVSWSTDAAAGNISASGLFTAVTDPGVRLGEIVTNGTIWADGTPVKGEHIIGTSTVVIQKSPAGRLSSISVVVQGTSGDSKLVSLATGESIQLEAFGRDAKGRNLSIYPSWSVEGGIGNMNTSGLFTATRPGIGAILATAGGFTGMIQMEVTHGPIRSLAIRPNILVLTTGAQYLLTATGYDPFENIVSLHNIRWSVDGKAVTIEPAGDTACRVSTVKAGNSMVSARAGDLIGSANIFVRSASVSLFEDTSNNADKDLPYYFEIEPELINVVPNSQQQFIVRAFDVIGNEIDPGDLSWSVTGNIGEIDRSGVFRAGSKTGLGYILATDGQIFGTAAVNVSEPTGQIYELLIIPSQFSLTAGSAQRFAALARTNDGLIPITPSWRTTGRLGTMDAAGRFVASTAGQGEIEAAAGGLLAKARVVVSTGKPVQIEIVPNSLSIRAGEQRKFTVISRDIAGNPVDSSPEFQILGDLGSISSDGVFTARKAGDGSVIVGACEGTLIEKAEIVVLPGELEEMEVIPETQVLPAGGSARFSAIGKDSYGNVIPVDPVWETSDSIYTGSISSGGVFMADKVGQGQILARAGGIIGTASVEVRPGDPAFILIEPALLTISPQSADPKQFKSTFVDLRGNTTEAVGNVELSWAVSEGIGSIGSGTGLFLAETNISEPRSGYVAATALITADSGMQRTIRGRATVILQPAAKPLAAVMVTPDPTLVIKGDKKKFAATGIDTDGTEVAVSPVWSIVSDDASLEIPGAISAAGVFSATSEMPVGSSWKVLASVTTSEDRIIKGEARISLIAGPLESVEISCENDKCSKPVESGQTVEIQAFGYDRFYNKAEILPDWSVIGGIGTVNPAPGSESKAVLTAGRAGSGEVIATDQGKEGKIHITVEPGPLASIDISVKPAPADDTTGKSEGNPLILKAGSDIQFTALGSDSEVDILGHVKPVNSVHVTPVWSVRSAKQDVDLGSVSADGKFVGREAGVGLIEAKVGSIAGSFHIQVIAGDLASIRVSPSSVSVVSGEGKKQQFSAPGYDLYGNRVVESAKPTWLVIGNIGDIDKDGLFTPVSLPAGSPGISGVIMASYGGVQGSSNVTVVSALGKLSALSLTVEPHVIQAGSQAICTLRGVDEIGNPLTDLPDSTELLISVPAELGTISPSNEPNEWFFRAVRNLPPDPEERSGMVTATAEIDGKTLSANTTVTLIPGQLNRIVIEPAEADLLAGSTAIFEASGYDSWGNQVALPSPEWSVYPDLGTVTRDTENPQEASFTASTAGQGKLTARSYGHEGSADLTILPGDLEYLSIEPKSLNIAAGSSHAFSITGRDKYGNEIKDPTGLNWQITGDVSIGSVTKDGLFSAKKAGNGKLKAVYMGATIVSSDEANITVLPGSIDSAGISMYKEGKVLVPPFVLLSGVGYDLHALGYDAWGNQIPNLEEVSWKITENTGSIVSTPENSSAAMLTTSFPGSGRITVTVKEISAYAEVEIVPHSQNVSARNGGYVFGPFEASIRIPPGALRTDEKISIALSPCPAPADCARQIGHVYGLKPDGKIFTSPAELTLSYSSVTTSEIDDERLSIYSWDRFQSKWIRVGGSVDSYQKSVTANVNYLTLFAIMQEDMDALDRPTNLDILDVRLSPNTYFAPEINRLTIHYNISFLPRQFVAVTIKIYDIKGHLVRELIDKTSKYPGWNTDQWDGTDETGEIVRNGRYFLVVTTEAGSDKISKVKHLAVFK